MKTAAQWRDCYAAPGFKERFVTETELGAIWGPEETVFRLWSPFGERAVLSLYKEGDGGNAFARYEMEQKKTGVWEVLVHGRLHGVYYDFNLTIEGEERRLADPYARACGINGKRSMVVDLSQTDPKGWKEDKAPANGTEQVICELHVKEFSWDPSGGFPEEFRGKYKAFTCKNTTLNRDGLHPTGLSYLKELGVTHVQLMPVYDYGSVDEAGNPAEFNWGYDPVNYNVPEGSYSTDPYHGEVRIRELKEMIYSLHKEGVRVIMDVVYNHTYSLDSWLQRAVPWYYYRVREDGTPANGSDCGNDVASEREMCARYILESVLYWAEEYHMDGFRFDLMGLLDTELMNRIRGELDQRFGRGEKLVFGEPWAAAPTAMEEGKRQALKENMKELDPEIGMFCDNTRDTIKGSVFRLKEPGFVNGAPGLEEDILKGVKAWCGGNEPGISVKAPSQVISYVSSHDNQTLWDKLSEMMEDEVHRRRAYRLAAGIYMTCQGRLFFLSGEEFARTKGGLENSFCSPVTVNRLDWEQTVKERELVEYYKGLIALRKQLPGLCDKSEQAAGRVHGEWTKDGAVGFFVDNRGNGSAWDQLYILYNRNETGLPVTLPEGSWQILADGESSFWWKENPGQTAEGEMMVSPVSILVLGKKNGRK